MWSASDLWYLFKLAIKTVTFVAVFGMLGWALYTSPSGIPEPPSTEAELRARAESILWVPDLTDGDGRRQDIRDPFVEKGEALRRIWGPWESAENRASWTAYDAAYLKRINKGASESTKILSDMRERSQAFCAALENEWIEKERAKFVGRLTVDEGIYLWQLRRQQSECRYWQSQLKKDYGS